MCTTRARNCVRISSTICRGGLHAHVGLDQHFRAVVQERVVDQPPLALEEVADVGVEQLRGLLADPA